jgi:hypothetical protein
MKYYINIIFIYFIDVVIINIDNIFYQYKKYLYIFEYNF